MIIRENPSADNPDLLKEAEEWILSRPASVRATMVKFPPLCIVKATRPLHVPPPGREGFVSSYFEHGDVSVVCEGIDIRAQCQPDWLEVVGYTKPFLPDWIESVLSKTK